MHNFSYQQTWVLFYLAGARPGVSVSPTELCEGYGDGNRNSAWASTLLKSLAERRLVNRTNRGHWSLSEQGRDVVQALKDQRLDEAGHRGDATSTTTEDYARRRAISRALERFLPEASERKKAAAAVLRSLKSLP